MGVMRFFTDPLDEAGEWPDPAASYLVGFDGRVMAGRAERSGRVLQVVRPVSDSAKLKTVWPVEGRGPTSLTTSSLREQEGPYNLAVELARGTLGQVRDQAAAWSLGGMALPPSYRKTQSEAFGFFSQAACRQAAEPAAAAVLAQKAIAAACRADDELLRAYALQKLSVGGRTRGLPVVLGCGVHSVPADEAQFAAAFGAASVPVAWPQVEPSEGAYDWSAADAAVGWASGHGLLLRGGPLVDFREGGLPGWLGQWSHDLPSLQSFVCDYVQTAVARHRGRVKFWNVAVGACPGGAFEIGEEDRLSLTARLIEAARRADDDSHVSLRIDQPWGQYQKDGRHRLTPMQFVDALARSNLGLGQLDLELNLMDPDVDDARRPLSDVSRLIDLWSIHGLPLHVTVRAEAAGGGPDEERLAKWAVDYVPLLMAKPTVTGVFWAQYSDRSGTPPCGVVDEAGRAKRTYDVFRRMRSAQG